MFENDCVCLYVCMSMILFVYVQKNNIVAMMVMIMMGDVRYRLIMIRIYDANDR